MLAGSSRLRSACLRVVLNGRSQNALAQPESKNLTRRTWLTVFLTFSQPPQMFPYSFGSTRSRMIKILTDKRDVDHQDVNLTAEELKIFACWIDLEVPHSGSYDSYVSRFDARRYRRLRENAQRWCDIEAKNIKRLAAQQQATSAIPDGHSNDKPVAIANKSEKEFHQHRVNRD
jgi:hypothetical protein